LSDINISKAIFYLALLTFYWR